MKICEDIEDFDYNLLKEAFNDFHDFLNFPIRKDNVVISIGLGIRAYNKIEDVKENLSSVGMKKILCKILNELNIDKDFEKLSTISEEITQLINELDDLYIEDSDISLKELESKYEGVVDKVKSRFEELNKLFQKEVLEAFLVLKDFGADEVVIRNVVAEAIFEDNIFEYLFDIFTEIALKAVEKMENSPTGGGGGGSY